MSPVDSCTMPRSRSSLLACVPFPAPGGPSKMMFMPSAPPNYIRASAPAAALQLRLLDEVAILMGDEMALDLGHRVHRHVDDDEQAGAAKIERNAGAGDQEFRYQADQGQIGG